MTVPIVPPPLSREIGAPTGETEEMLTQGDPQEDAQARAALAALYGPTFPPLMGDDNPERWAAWARDRWEHHGPGVRNRLHLVERNRKFRDGDQWIDSKGGSAWREPPKPRDVARIVDNVVAPALDLRVQIVAEQKPGFRTKAATQDPDDLKKAEAQQIALEYQYDAQAMGGKSRELAFWCGTDACGFLEIFWNPDKGPWHEARGENGEPLDAQGNPVPQQEGAEPGAPHKFPLGDVDSRFRRIEQVRVSAEASACVKPWYWIIRDVMPLALAVREYGPIAAEQLAETGDATDRSTAPSIIGGYLHPEPDELYRDQETLDRFTVYCEPSEYLPGGLQMIVLGDKVVRGPMPLLVGVVPMVRYTDGSSDPSFYPKAEVEKWIPTQQRINAIKSKWVENIRLNAGPKFLAREGAITTETLVGGINTVIGVKGIEQINSVVRPLESFGIGADAKELLALEMKRFEDMSGWNDVTRGSFSSEQSGRAILAIREQLERLFAPMVASFAMGHSEWGKINLAFMKWGYDLPRTIGIEGKNRPDLARALTADDFDGATDVFVDPETMMPMPRAMKQFQLDDLFAKQLIGPRDYLRRSAFANNRMLATPDDDQESSARRYAETIRITGQMPQPNPMMWVLDEAIHQDVLERELILPPDVHPQVKAAAWQFWMFLAQQAQMKAGVVPPGSPQPQGQQGGQAPQNPQGGPSAMLQGPASPVVTDPQSAARQFEQTAPR